MHITHTRLPYMHAGTQTCPPSLCTTTPPHTHTSDRLYTDVPVITMTMSTHTYCCLTRILSHNELEALSLHCFFWASL